MFENVRAVEVEKVTWADLAFPGRVGTDPRRPVRIAGCDDEKWVVKLLGACPATL